MRRDVPLRRSLLLKLMVLAALVSACSIAATAWLTVHTTAVAIQQEQGQAFADDAEIYDALLGYAATHHDWAGAAGTVRDLARKSGHRITLTDEDRRPLLDSAAPGSGTGSDSVRPGQGGPGLPAEASATVDPFAVDGNLVSRQPAASVTGQSGVSVAVTDTPAPRPGRCAAGTRCLTSAGQPSAQPSAQLPSEAAGQQTGAFHPAVPSTIDARAVGPFRLTAGERTTLRGIALRTAACLRDTMHLTAQVARTPAGRSVVQVGQANLYLPTDCDTTALDAPTATENRALNQLDGLVNTCLDRHGAPPVRLNLDFSWSPRSATGRTRTEQSDSARPTDSTDSAGSTGSTDSTAGSAADPDADSTAVGACVETGRREQLAPYVAPPALLFVSSPRQDATTFLDLSAGNRARIAEVTGLVLLLTLAVTALLGTRMIRPLRALAGAARRMTDGDLTARVSVRAGDEIGSVAAAFNTMSERREQSEGLRKAMVSDVAHELRTPLSNIRGWLEAAQDGLVVPDKELVGSLLDEAVLLQHVIDDLRDLSAADAGELRLRTAELDLTELLGQVTTAHRGNADAAGVTLATGAEGRPVVVADPVRLRQAVGNLVSNAVRHTPAGGTVTLRARTAGAGQVVIEVADTGSGIAPGDLPRVFDRFWRAEKSRSRQTGGSGLGLSIVRKLAEAHGGSVGATSVQGRGSVFTITLPASSPPR
ncbi:HAMP domain-containing histidine kinase [Streptomyces sp. NBC_01476]|uniref:sensor histidine kinase n=1 Tax=Streptomyces sp. NBC_01476 TaxID=2903881 RepID=UPI002E347F7F|nr:HAMP domain-containing sensor histidine kinase [Streptomyces sp. NBC_01476]